MFNSYIYIYEKFHSFPVYNEFSNIIFLNFLKVFLCEPAFRGYYRPKMGHLSYLTSSMIRINLPTGSQGSRRSKMCRLDFPTSRLIKFSSNPDAQRFHIAVYIFADETDWDGLYGWSFAGKRRPTVGCKHMSKLHPFGVVG